MVQPVHTKRDVIARLQTRGVPMRAMGVRRIGLFGSFVADQQESDSDVDLLVEFEPAKKTFDNYWALSELLEDLLQRPVDLLTTESLSPYIGPRILAEVEYVSIAE